MVDMYMPRHMMTLSKEEKNIVKYHHDTIKSGKVGRDAEGRPVTVYSTGIMIPEGPNKGKFVSVPGYVRDQGKIVRDEDELYKIWERDIKSGKFPVYNTPQELNKRSLYISNAPCASALRSSGISGPGSSRHHLRCGGKIPDCIRLANRCVELIAVESNTRFIFLVPPTLPS
jgi:hypothetical protein